VPLVLIDRPIEGVHASFVGGNNQAMGELATGHLIDVGCRRIAHLRGPHLGIAEGRMAGFLEALAKADVPLTPNFILDAGYDDFTGYTCMRELLRSAVIPDGVFCFNDPVAIGAMKAIFEAGLRVPQDIAVAGVGNVHYSDALSVPLTTVDQGTREIGARAAQILLAQMTTEEHASQPETVLVQPRIVIRESTRRSPHNRVA
jgi:LacI family transcriptional regulator